MRYLCTVTQRTWTCFETWSTFESPTTYQMSVENRQVNSFLSFNHVPNYQSVYPKFFKNSHISKEFRWKDFCWFCIKTHLGEVILNILSSSLSSWGHWDIQKCNAYTVHSRFSILHKSTKIVRNGYTKKIWIFSISRTFFCLLFTFLKVREIANRQIYIRPKKCGKLL